MAKREYTKEQLSAINTTDKTLLVSAGAGAGKTATLTERIIRQLTSEEHPADISRMLIVTFTKATVAELKERIHNAIKDKINECPENTHLEKELHLLPSAKIATIDSFCNDIFKNNAEKFGVSPKYRIADPLEATILARTVCTTLIGAIYDGLVPEVMSSDELSFLSDALSSVKDEYKLEEVFLKLYVDSQSLVEGVDIFDKHIEKYKTYKNSPSSSEHISYAITLAKDMARYHAELLESHKADLILEDIQLKKLRENNPDPITDKKKQAKAPKESPESAFALDFDSLIERCNNLSSASSYEKISKILSGAFEKAPEVPKTECTPTLILAQELRKSLKSDFADVYSRFFAWTVEEWSETYSSLIEVISLLSRFLHKFDELYFEEKRSRQILEYSDIERLAHKSLYNDDGSLTDYALAERELYDSIYIDEYQDVNSLQDSIFRAIAKDNNRFMVGDIKQSIYGFRGASADIFRKMKVDFPELKEGSPSPAASIFMSENFRCDRGIIDFVNATFERLFTLKRDSIGYVVGDNLICSKYKNKEEPPTKTPVLKIFAKNDAEGLDEEEAGELSARYVAKEIKRLMSECTLDDGSPITASDIAILLRKDAGRGAKYKKVLKEEGINAETAKDKSFFFNSEIQLALCLLNSIDNPHRDIYLAGLMLSPLYSFTPDELVIIRKSSDKKVLWQALVSYCEENVGFAKGISFINEMKRYRTLSEGMATDELILRLYNETGLSVFARKLGSRENLMLLYNFARDFEGSSYKGLYSFIDYINTAIARGASISQKKSDSASDAVTITTIHDSKGLEYPIVFIAEAGGELISRMDKNLPYRYLEKSGTATKIPSRKSNAIIESPIYNVINDMNDERAINEELRVYYVAFTRAREYLYIVGKTSKDTLEDLILSKEPILQTTSPYALRKMNSLIDLVCFSGRPDDKYEIDIEEKEDTPLVLNAPETKSEEKDEISSGKAADLGRLLTERISFEYPSIHLTTLPEKMSISTVYPTVLDGTDEEAFNIINEEEREECEEKTPTVPEFIQKNKVDESARRGIATHLFMQFANLEALQKTSASAELSRLFELGYISREDMERVRIREIDFFKRSSLLSEMLGAKKLYREFRFNVNLPASLFTEDEEKKEAYKDTSVLLQGVIDCIIEDKDGTLHLIDYKTDRLTKEELADKSLAEKKLSDKHSLQLYYYSLAVEKIFGKTPKTKRIYSLVLGECIYLD